MNFEALLVNPNGSTAREPFIGALAVLLAAVAFYYFLVPGRTGAFALLMLLYPGMVLHARRLHAMGRNAWLVFIPGALIALAAGLHLYAPDAAAVSGVTWAAIAVSALFVLWGLLGKDGAAA